MRGYGVPLAGGGGRRAAVGGLSLGLWVSLKIAKSYSGCGGPCGALNHLARRCWHSGWVRDRSARRPGWSRRAELGVEQLRVIDVARDLPLPKSHGEVRQIPVPVSSEIANPGTRRALLRRSQGDRTLRCAGEMAVAGRRGVPERGGAPVVISHKKGHAPPCVRAGRHRLHGCGRDCLPLVGAGAGRQRVPPARPAERRAQDERLQLRGDRRRGRSRGVELTCVLRSERFGRATGADVRVDPRL